MLDFLSFPLHWVLCVLFFAFSFHQSSFQQVRLLPCLASASRGPSQIVSARLNLRNGTIYVKGVCNFLGSVSPQQKFEATNGSVLLPCVVAQFYIESKGKYILEAWGQVDPKDSERRETPSSILAPLFICFSPPPEPAVCKLGKSAVLPEVLTLVLGPSFVLFSWAFPFCVF